MTCVQQLHMGTAVVHVNATRRGVAALRHSERRGSRASAIGRVKVDVLGHTAYSGHHCVLASKASHTHPHSRPTPLNSAGARGQHRCNTRLGAWTKFNNKERKE